MNFLLEIMAWRGYSISRSQTISLYFRLNSSLPWTPLQRICPITNFFTALKVLSKGNQLTQEEGWVFSSPKTLIVKIKPGITLNNLQGMGPAFSVLGNDRSAEQRIWPMYSSLRGDDA